MQIKTTSGSGGAGLGVIGTGLAMALPEAKWIGWALVALGVVVIVFDVRIERGHVAIGSSQSLGQRLKRVWPQYLMVFSGCLFFVGLVGFLQLNVTPPKHDDNSGNPPNQRKPSASLPPSLQPPPTVPGILLDFSFDVLPRISPSEGTVHAFEINEGPAGVTTGPVEYMFNPNQVIDWGKFLPEWAIVGHSKCEITSTTNESVFDAVIPIILKFREMKKR
jgi:hypothetical protein